MGTGTQDTKIDPYDRPPLPIPKIIHFIWVGGPIYPKYLKSIQGVAEAAERSGYTVNLWVDNESNYYKTAEQEGIQVPSLQLRNIQKELFDPMKDDPFYIGEDLRFPLKENEKPGDRARYFQQCVQREMVGFKNLAAASDFLRYEILRKEGGWYCDTDTYFVDINPPFYPTLSKRLDDAQIEMTEKNLMIEKYLSGYRLYLQQISKFNKTHLPVPPLPPDAKLKNIARKEYDECMALLGNVATNAKQEVGKKLKYKKPLFSKKVTVAEAGVKLDVGRCNISRDHDGQVTSITFNGGINNDMLACSKDSASMARILIDCMDAYREADKQADSAKQGRHTMTNMDKKRIPGMDVYRHPKSGAFFDARRDQTIKYAGPGAVAREFERLWQAVESKAQAEPDREKRSQIYYDALDAIAIERKIAGIEVAGMCDNTWVQEKKDLHGFDAESIKRGVASLQPTNRSSLDRPLSRSRC